MVCVCVLDVMDAVFSVCIVRRGVLKYGVCLCIGCDGCYVLCLYC